MGPTPYVWDTLTHADSEKNTTQVYERFCDRVIVTGIVPIVLSTTRSNAGHPSAIPLIIFVTAPATEYDNYWPIHYFIFMDGGDGALLLGVVLSQKTGGIYHGM